MSQSFPSHWLTFRPSLRTCGASTCLFVCCQKPTCALPGYLKPRIAGSKMCRKHCLKEGLVRRRSTKHPTPDQIFQRHRPHATIICHQHPQTSNHICSPPLHSLNPLRLQVSNQLMLAPTLASPAIFFLSSCWNIRCQYERVRCAVHRVDVIPCVSISFSPVSYLMYFWFTSY